MGVATFDWVRSDPGSHPGGSAGSLPEGSLAIRIRDALGVLFQDEDFAVAFSTRGRPALSPARLALVSILRFGEELSDRQTAEAVRARIDWKYALGLELTDAGFDYSVLSEFRDRLVVGSLEQSLLDTILERAVTAGMLRAGGRQRTDSTHVLMAMRTMNRLEQVHETVRAALNALAAAAPGWLPAQAEPGWFERYEVRVEDCRLPENRAQPRTRRSPRHRAAGTDDARQCLAKCRGQRLRRQ
uniref:transposase n=1 Tax=Nonomuraea phyllanthi TaxID=2219224 RepID=UPI00186AC8C8|nr:transposase [Nonomuraea phyllanthi]